MENNTLGEEIARYRKEAGLTQEELGRAVGISAQAVSRWECGGTPDVTLLPAIARRLGVSIDALFGRETGEREDVEETVGRWLGAMPERERMERLCRLVWRCVRYFVPEGIDVPQMEYLKNCRNSLDGKIMYTKLQGGGGLLMDVHAEDMSFVTLWPEPKEGYAPFFAPMESYRRLFAVLAKPHCLELLDSLYWKKSNFFIPAVIARQSGIPQETVSQLLEELVGLGVLWSMKLELEEGEVTAYKLAEPLGLVPFLLAAQGFMETSSNYVYFYDDEKPLLRGAEWKRKRGENDETEEG